MGDEARSADGAVTTSRAGTVLHITLDRISHRNALSYSMIDTLIEVLVAAASDDALRAVHLRGAGTDFCAGVDWVGSNSEAINHSQHATLNQAMTQELFNLELACRTADFKEGLAAFREKRGPDFTGR